MAYRNDLGWMRFQGLKGLTRKQYVNALIGCGADISTGVQLGVVELISGQLIGDLYVKVVLPVAWIGFTVNPAVARQGYGLEAVDGLVNVLAKLPGLTMVKAEVDPANAASIGLLAKLGFLLEGTDEGLCVFWRQLVAPPQTDVDQYIAALPGQQRDIMTKVRAVIAQSAPGAQERMSYGMPSFRQGQTLIWYAAAKHHLGIYPTASGVAAFAVQLGDYILSKGTIRIPWNGQIPYGVIGEITTFRLAQVGASQARNNS